MRTVNRRQAAAAIAGFAALPSLASSPIVLGRTGAYSGIAAPLGMEQVAGAKALFAKVNASGGVKGRSIELRELDDQFDPKAARANALKLTADGALAIFLSQGTAQTLSLLEGLDGSGMPVIAPYSGAATVYAHLYPQLFRFRASYDDEVFALVRHFTTVGWKKLGLVRLSNALGDSLERTVKQAVTEAGASLVEIASVNVEGTDAGAAAEKLHKAAPQAVLITSFSLGATRFIREYRKTAAASPMATLSLLTSQQIQDLGQDAVGLISSQVMPLPGDQKFAIVRDFIKDMDVFAAAQRKTYLSLEGYAAAKWLVHALTNGGSESRAGLVKSLTNIRGLDIGGIRLDSTGNRRSASSFVDIVIVDSGLNFRR